VRVGEYEAAEAHLARIESLARQRLHPPASAAALHVAGILCAARGDEASAIQKIGASVAMWRAMARPFDEARTLLDLAVVQRASGAAPEASATLRAALDLFTRLRAAPYQEIAARRSREWGHNVPGNSPARSSQQQLTAREIEIVRLVALGRKNREIAAALTISPLTAETHVRNILRKLGVNSRTALAAYATCHRLATRPAGPM